MCKPGTMMIGTMMIIISFVSPGIDATVDVRCDWQFDLTEAAHGAGVYSEPFIGAASHASHEPIALGHSLKGQPLSGAQVFVGTGVAHGLRQVVIAHEVVHCEERRGTFNPVRCDPGFDAAQAQLLRHRSGSGTSGTIGAVPRITL